MRQLKLILASALALLLANTPASFASEDDWVLSGTIEINSTQIALIGSGSRGSGAVGNACFFPSP